MYDSEFLAQFTHEVDARDQFLRNHDIDPQEFEMWAREQFIGNECGTDEYRETQPSKGLGMIAMFMMDLAPGQEACEQMIELTRKWLNAVDTKEWWYSGAEELEPIMDLVFDFEWHKGNHPYHRNWEDYIDEQTIEWYKEDQP
jgi:hypothetical protein